MGVQFFMMFLFPMYLNYLHMSRCKISWRFLFIGGSKSFFFISWIWVFPMVNWCVRRAFLKKSMQNKFFTAYRPKMAQIDKKGLKVTHLKSKDRFSAWNSCNAGIEAWTCFIFWAKKIVQKTFDPLYRPRNGQNRPKWLFQQIWAISRPTNNFEACKIFLFTKIYIL